MSKRLDMFDTMIAKGSAVDTEIRCAAKAAAIRSARAFSGSGNQMK